MGANGRSRVLRRRLVDERSGRVVFVSHCLLNENVRYLGGATRPGAVDELVAAVAGAGVGFCQMPCPEQRAWGGVLKRELLQTYGVDRRGLRPVRRRLLPLLVAYTRWRYRRLARQVATEVADYVRSGYDVVGIVGVDGSPSCGVRRTIDFSEAADAIGSCDPATVTRAAFNDRVVASTIVPGPGLFIAEIRRQLRRRRLAVPLFAHDLLEELAGARGVPTDLEAALGSVR